MIKIALAGQPNCGKSTIFTMLSGVNQHIANYPGVTVDKKTAHLSHSGEKIEIVDLPGTYSFSSFSLEERVAKDYLINENPDLIINVIDASNIKRSLYLTFQLLELGKPVVIILNMMDVAKRRGLEIDVQKFSELLKVRVVEAVGSRNIGKKEILSSITEAHKHKATGFEINYEELEPYIARYTEKIKISSEISPRWFAIKALEADEAVLSKAGITKEDMDEEYRRIHSEHQIDIDSFLASVRYQSADYLYHKCVKETSEKRETFTSRADRVILNRWLAFPFLAGVIYLVYQLSIVLGYKLTNYTWPYLAMLKNFIISVLPEPQFTDVPILTDFGIWMTNSALALLNYVPIFLILFALIAIIEDIGYMPRIAFILDRVFKRYGLHGQSTLPLVLGGAFVGGCAVPGVMATKGIADERARLATILTVPYMNCLAKVPFYALLLGAFFEGQMTVMMFFISTVTIFIALSVARLITLTFLKNRETAPFVMELPPYHLPTIKGVVLRAFQRVWVYIKKVGSIVLAVAVVLFMLLQFPGVSADKQAEIRKRTDAAVLKFYITAEATQYHGILKENETVYKLINIYNTYRAQKMTASSSAAAERIDAALQAEYPELAGFIIPENDEQKLINREIRTISRTGQTLLNDMKSEKIRNSFLGMFGRSLEPITQFAGFDWRVNVAFLSSFAARESAVATLGSIYETGKTDQRAEEAISEDGLYTPLHAVAMLIFMILTPPCIATMIVVRIQTGSYGWMMFAIFFPMILGVVMASVFFKIGTAFNLTGLQTMLVFYVSMAVTAVAAGLFKGSSVNWKGGYLK
ncbi:ferrous iron transport protein B [Geovibrio thiophilus]|uniref:Ferrous iron transport protein B n=1 Tax=Geovibrio thiophilus TaxID=139438 RepID=A0A3R5Z034_9BACT|nr:ferrous iron transport protein B [Geovibrio thiophilus]QAR33738.1 ferrous iron transport protein B [Geovibrio thiophilus]